MTPNILKMLITCAIVFIYFLPWFIAFVKNHKQAIGIFILNLFLGWTLVGWVIALIWSCIKSETKLTVEEFELLKEQILHDSQK